MKPASTEILLDAAGVADTLDRLAREVFASLPAGVPISVIGIRSRGEVLAARLVDVLHQLGAGSIDCGTLDITLYRDDLNNPQSNSQPEVRTTEIGFDIDGRVVFLVDDVLYTGRSTRAAMDALIDLGRPKAIRLAVLVDRAGREFPIQADYAGYRTDVEPGKLVQVNLQEADGIEKVVIP